MIQTGVSAHYHKWTPNITNWKLEKHIVINHKGGSKLQDIKHM